MHFAEDLRSNKLACKLQYPDMNSAVQADLNQLKLIFSIYERYDSAISTNAIHQELSERLKEELDYKQRHSKIAHGQGARNSPRRRGLVKSRRDLLLKRSAELSSFAEESERSRS